MAIMPAQLDQSIPESVEKFVEGSWFLWQAGIQSLPYLARAGRGIEPSISNRAEILRHEFHGSIGPRPNLLGSRTERVRGRQIFTVVNPVQNLRLAPGLS